MRMTVDRSIPKRSAASLWLSSPVTSCNHSSYFWLGLRNRLARRPRRSRPESCWVISTLLLEAEGPYRMRPKQNRDVGHEVRRKTQPHWLAVSRLRAPRRPTQLRQRRLCPRWHRDAWGAASRRGRGLDRPGVVALRLPVLVSAVVAVSRRAAAVPTLAAGRSGARPAGRGPPAGAVPPPAGPRPAARSRGHRAVLILDPPML